MAARPRTGDRRAGTAAARGAGWRPRDIHTECPPPWGGGPGRVGAGERRAGGRSAPPSDSKSRGREQPRRRPEQHWAARTAPTRGGPTGGARPGQGRHRSASYSSGLLKLVHCDFRKKLETNTPSSVHTELKGPEEARPLLHFDACHRLSYLPHPPSKGRRNWDRRPLSEGDYGNSSQAWPSWTRGERGSRPLAAVGTGSRASVL